MTDIFLITSVIQTGNVPWSYAQRSAYSPQERFDQTLRTIQSIRDLSDNSRIFLIECSNLPKEMEDIVREKVDIYLNCFNDDEARNACINSNKKGYGEIIKTKIAVEYLVEKNIQFARLFKISGRYWINENFTKAAFSNDMYTFANNGKCDICTTVIYSVPFSLLADFMKNIQRCISIYNQQIIGLETLLPPMCNPKQLIPRLGASGLVAVDSSVWTY